MEEYIRKYWRDSLLSSILLLMLAVILIIKPVEALTVIIILFGAILIVAGIAHIIAYFYTDKNTRMFNFEMIEGFVSLLLGIAMVANPAFVSNFLTVIVGVWMVFSSIIRIQISVNMQTIEGKSWIWMLILSSIILITGVLIVANPAQIATTLPSLVGVLLFVAEFINIIEYICIIPKAKKIMK